MPPRPETGLASCPAAAVWRVVAVLRMNRPSAQPVPAGRQDAAPRPWQRFEVLHLRFGPSRLHFARVRRIAIALSICTLLGSMQVFGDVREALGRAGAHEQAGEFQAADAVLAAELGVPGLAPPDQERLLFERDRLRRIRRDFRLTRGEVWEGLQQVLPTATPKEFGTWIADGTFDVRHIDGKERFFVSSVSNLFFRHPELESRRRPVRNRSALQLAYFNNASAIRAAALRAGAPYVLPRRFQVRMTLRVHPGATTPGDAVSAWLPIPRELPFQKEFRLLNTTLAGTQVAAPTAPLRSVFLQEPAASDGSAVFRIDYAFATWGVSFPLHPAESLPETPGDPGLPPFLGEAPHVKFTPEMRDLAVRIAGGETNPVRRARRFHDWIAENIRYSFAPEYSTVRNLGELCRRTGHGDCGQAVFVYMTLCRLSGIPARWQSGWAFFPGDQTIHDWCEIHLQPWGWVPVDPYMGMYAMQYATTLSPSQRAELRDFYFGGLTQYRMSANGDHDQPLSPPKSSVRSDDVDFQRGEVDAGGRNVFYDQLDYDFEWREQGQSAGESHGTRGVP